MPDALDLLKTRRSVKPIELAGPAPTAAEIETLLTVASRVPDHGKLTPWRFIVFEGDARLAAGDTIAAVFRANRPDATPDQVEIERKRLARAPLVIAVVSRAAPHVKIPEWEQVLSAGAAAMSLVIAAHALGYAASWLTEWYAYDRRVLDALGLAPNERIAGFVHIGRPAKPPKTGRGRRSTTSSRASAPTEPQARKHHVLRHPQERPRPAAQSVQGHRRAAPDRLDHLDERQGRDQSRALLVLQRHHRQAADRDVLQRRPQGLGRLRRGDQGVRLQPRDLRSARPDERHLGAAAARRQRDEGDRARSRAVAAGQAAARRRLALRARMQMAADRAVRRRRRPARSTATSCSARWSASTSTTASSRTAGSTPRR